MSIPLSPLRQEAEKTPFAWWGRYLRPIIDPSKTGEFHKELSGEIDRALLPGNFFVGLLPRGHTKTTLGTTGTVAYAAATRRKRHIGVFGVTQDLAEEKLDNVVYVMQTSDEIRRDYGLELTPKLRENSRRDKKNTTKMIILANDVILFAMEAGAKRLRGRNVNGNRPDLYVFDDPEDEDQVAKAAYRAKFNNWLAMTAIPAFAMDKGQSQGSIIWPGTLLHHASPLGMLVKQTLEEMAEAEAGGAAPEWRAMVYKAFWKDPDGNIRLLWPENFTYDALMKIKAKMRKASHSDAAFNREYLHDPTADEDRTFPSSCWRFYTYEWLVHDGGRWGLRIPGKPFEAFARIGQATDPAWTRSKQSNKTAIVTIGKLKSNGRYYYLNVLTLEGGLSQVEEAMKAQYGQWKPDFCLLASSGSQTGSGEAVIRQTGLPIQLVKESTPKSDRIEVLARHHINGMMVLPGTAKCPWSHGYIETCEQFKPGVECEDDAPDAAAHCMDKMMPGSGVGGVYSYETQTDFAESVRSF